MQNGESNGNSDSKYNNMDKERIIEPIIIN